MVYHCPVENTLILRGFREYNTRKRPFLHAHLQVHILEWPKHGFRSSRGQQEPRRALATNSDSGAIMLEEKTRFELRHL